MDKKESINGYEIKRSIVFDNDRGVALAENPRAVQPFVTWMFFEDKNGERSYEWGHYTTNRQNAESDYHARISKYILDNGVSERATAHAPKRISDQLKDGADQAAIDNAALPKPGKNVEKDR